MPSLKALRGRIRSVKNTRQITKTMKMVAAAKVRRARSAVENARPYANHLANILGNIAASVGTSGPLLFTGRKAVKTVCLVVVGSDRGLCGGLNSNLLKTAYRWIEAEHARGRQVKLIAVGRKIREAFRSTYPELLIAEFSDMGRSVEFAHAQTVATRALEAFTGTQADEVHLMYAHFVSMLTQAPSVQQLIPFAQPETSTMASAPEYEPDEETILAHLLPLNLNMQVFTALLDTSASEQAARMTAMDSATRNAGEMIKRLSVQYNRSRQASITKELIEIISGAEAL